MILEEFLAKMTTLFHGDFDSFETYRFAGTSTELVAGMAGWQPPQGLAVVSIDLAAATAAAAAKTDAQNLVDADLRSAGEGPGRSIIVVSGLHILAAMYGSNMLQPLNRWLRRGSRATLLIASPALELDLPSTASLVNWREIVSDAIDGDHVITSTGLS